MLKFLFPILVGLIGVTASADIQTTTYHIVYDWFHVYPDGYLITEDTYVPLYKAPDNFEEVGYCDLKKGRSFHNMSHLNENDTFAMITGVKTYLATKDISVYVDGPVNYPKHSIVYQLSHMNEGVCFIQFNDEIFEDQCLQDLDGFHLVNASPIQETRLIETVCDNHKAGWILESDLIEQTKSNSDDGPSVQILTEDEFIERGWITYDDDEEE